MVCMALFKDSDTKDCLLAVFLIIFFFSNCHSFPVPLKIGSPFCQHWGFLFISSLGWPIWVHNQCQSWSMWSWYVNHTYLNRYIMFYLYISQDLMLLWCNYHLPSISYHHNHNWLYFHFLFFWELVLIWFQCIGQSTSNFNTCWRLVQTTLNGLEKIYQQL